MNNVLLLLLSLYQILQTFVFAQITFDTTPASTLTIVNQCQCFPGSTCPSGVGSVDIRIVNTGPTCPTGYVYCCPNNNNNDPNCGVRKIEPSAHPVGQAAYGAYPWMVAILTNNDVYVGGGVLISTTHVLTVAHKVASYANGGIKARLGDWDVQTTTEPDPYVDIPVLNVILHPQYNPQNLTNDIAVLKLSSAAPVAPNINTACLPSAAAAAKSRCWVSGWGKDAFGDNGKYASILKEVDVPVVSSADCQTELRKTRLGSFFVLDNSFMCAGGEVGKDACTGDGGSPLVCSTNGGPYQVAGLVTWGIGCASTNVPGVYTNVYHFLSWIKQQMT